jgi:acyl-CoA synthetase (AMP-forming)/AMP-acid ligase II
MLSNKFRNLEDWLFMKHPDVSEATVIGIPDPDSGEAVKTFAVLKQGAQITQQELIAFCRIAVYKAPCLVEFVDSLPRNPAGKILKRELRAREQKATEPSTMGSASEGR